MKQQISFDAATQKNIDAWLQGHYDEATKKELKDMLAAHPEQLVDAFYTKLTFGTGGLRGIMGIGSNRMNSYTVGAATQGLANYLNKQPREKGLSVLIGYDSRHHSKEFAEEAARILAASGIKCYLFADLRPVPLVSFGCRYKKCSAAIMITASHNPPEYNGYKVFWNDGAQVLPPHDQGIIQEVNAITDVDQIHKVELPNPLIEIIHEELDEAYIKAVHGYPFYPKQDKEEGNQLKIVYTSLHGAGITLVPKVLKDWGFTNLTFVDKQVIPDGDFPTVHYPNPEEPSALELGIQKLLETKGDILIATDPDTDRMGVVTLHKGKPVIFNGNETICLSLYHICTALTEQNRMPANAAFVKTIVTTELFKTIASRFNKPCSDVLTGFKYIGEKIREWEEEKNGLQFIYGGEESYGSLLGTHARDKDAVIFAALISEVALHAKLQGMTLVDLLHKIYQTYGLYREKLVSVEHTGKEGAEKIRSLMSQLRQNPPKQFLNIPVTAIEDYKTSLRTDFPSNKTTPLTLPKSDVLLFWLKDGSKLVIRPSGTEPKIKLYGGVVHSSFASIEQGIAEADAHLDSLLQALKSLLS